MKQFIVFITTLMAILYCKTGFAQYEDTLVRVYRYLTPDNQYVTEADDEYADGEITNKGWTGKQLLFYGYHKPGAGRLAVYSWFNPISMAHISIAEDEYTDEQMLKNGYIQKHFQFYALTRQGRYTVVVYRWLMSRRHAWVTIPEDTDTDVYLKNGYHHKTFQYYGIACK